MTNKLIDQIIKDFSKELFNINNRYLALVDTYVKKQRTINDLENIENIRNDLKNHG